MHAALGGQQAVGVAALDDEGGRQQSGLLARGRLVDLEVEAAALGPAQVHAQHHLGPVLRVGPAGTGVDLGHGVAVVVRAGEQRAQLELAEPAVEVVDHRLDLGPDRVVGLLLDELEEGLGVGQLLAQAVELLEVLVHPAQLGGHRPGVVGVVPQARLGGLLLQLGPAVVEAVEVEEAPGLGKRSPSELSAAGEVDPLGLPIPPTGTVGRRHLSWRRGRA